MTNLSLATLVGLNYASSYKRAITSQTKAKISTSTTQTTILVDARTCLGIRNLACYTLCQYRNDLSSTLRSILSTVPRVKQAIT